MDTLTDFKNNPYTYTFVFMHVFKGCWKSVQAHKYRGDCSKSSPKSFDSRISMCTQACVTNGVAGWWGLINFQKTHWSQQQQLNERSHWRKKKLNALLKFTQPLLFPSLNFVLEKVKAKSPLTFNTTTFLLSARALGCPDFLKALDVVGLSWLSPFCIIQLNSILFLRRQIKLTVGSNWIWLFKTLYVPNHIAQIKATEE